MDYSSLSAFIGVGMSASTGAGRVSHILKSHLASQNNFANVLLNRDSSWLEIQRQNNQVEKISRGFRKAGKSVFTLSLKGKIPAFRKSFLETQNLACLKIPRAGIFAFDIFYRTHPDTWADIILGRTLYRGLKDYPFILTCSEYSRGEISECFKINPKKIKVVPLDCDRSVFKIKNVDKTLWLKKNNLPSDKIILSHVSSGDKRKNLPGILKAFQLVLEKYPDAIFIKAGKILRGHNHDSLLKLIDSMGLKQKVFFLEGLSDHDLSDLYNVSDVFLFPSLAEGFGIPVLEAQASGCPVVTSNSSSLKEIAGPLCLAVNPTDSISIATAVDEILKNPLFRLKNQDPNEQYLLRFNYDRAKQEVFNWLFL